MTHSNNILTADSNSDVEYCKTNADILHAVIRLLPEHPTEVGDKLYPDNSDLVAELVISRQVHAVAGGYYMLELVIAGCPNSDSLHTDNLIAVYDKDGSTPEFPQGYAKFNQKLVLDGTLKELDLDFDKLEDEFQVTLLIPKDNVSTASQVTTGETVTSLLVGQYLDDVVKQTEVLRVANDSLVRSDAYTRIEFALSRVKQLNEDLELDLYDRQPLRRR